jgi:hypothetical protein
VKINVIRSISYLDSYRSIDKDLLFNSKFFLEDEFKEDFFSTILSAKKLNNFLTFSG